ncbi:unnamed protein product [Peniophora sp. CBMAI 1063]|nr:unnamed protein product [Peniophora sp. CBMAI 1063]
MTTAFHRPGWPDWNNPDLVWEERQVLDLSRPLTIPPSIIYWSVQYNLPVYAHPRFDPESTRIYARPYASSLDGFSDYSAAEQRRKLGLPPLDNPPIIRPQKILYSLECETCPDEDVLARRVAMLLPTLRPDDERLPEPPPEGPAKVTGPPPRLSGFKLKRTFESDSEDSESDVPQSPRSASRRSPPFENKRPDNKTGSTPKRRKTSPSPPLPSPPE